MSQHHWHGGLPSGEVEVLCTSRVDSRRFAVDLFGQLYQLRRPVEEKIQRDKCRAEIENFSGKSALSVMQDSYTRIFMLNLARILAWPAEPEIQRRNAERKYRYQLNWASALKAIKQVLRKLFYGPRSREIFRRLQDWFVCNVEPIRPGRRYSRNHKSHQRIFYITYKSSI